MAALVLLARSCYVIVVQSLVCAVVKFSALFRPFLIAADWRPTRLTDQADLAARLRPPAEQLEREGHLHVDGELLRQELEQVRLRPHALAARALERAQHHQSLLDQILIERQLRLDLGGQPGQRTDLDRDHRADVERLSERAQGCGSERRERHVHRHRPARQLPR